MSLKIRTTPLNKAAILLVPALMVALCVQQVAHASNFGPYSYVSNEVSVSYAQVKRDTWTWKFLNNSRTTTITYMAFKYTDKDGDHNALLPGPLKPGASSGGANVFTASSRPSITIKQIKRSAK